MFNKTVCLLIFLVILACAPPMTEQAVYDFIGELSQAEREFDSFVIDMSRSEHYQYLSDGWHIPDQITTPETRFVWSSDNESEVILVSANDQEKELIISLQPYRFEGAPPLTMRLYLNQHHIGRINLQESWRTYRLTIPAEHVQTGNNTLTVVQSHVFSPSDVMVYSEDTRQLGSSWSSIVFRDVQPPKSPGFYSLPEILGAREVQWTGQRRQVIYDTAPSYFSWPLTLPSRPVLSFGIGFLPDYVERYGPNARFEITLKDETGDTHRLFRSELKPPKRILEKGWTEYSRSLAAFAGQSVQITLETSSDITPEGLIGSGSWLEPHILNRHVNYNMIFLPIADYFDHERIPPGTALEQTVMRAQRTVPLPSPAKDETAISGIPAEFISMVTSEGFWTGCFYAGYDPFEKHRKTRPLFRYTTGFEHVNADSYESLFEDCTDWIKTLDKRRFMILFDIAGWTSDSNLEYSQLFGMLEWLLKYQFEKDSLIMIYGLNKTSPVWILNPMQRASSISEIDSWEELFHYITTEFLHL